jgi:hypothetical protein
VSTVVDNQVRDAGARALATALESNRILTTLELRGADPTCVVIAAVLFGGGVYGVCDMVLNACA